MPAILINGKTINFKTTGSCIVVDGREIEFSLLREEKGRLLVRIGSSIEEIVFSENGRGMEVFHDNSTTHIEVLSDRDLLLRSLESRSSVRHGHSEIKAPMPGLVVKALVKKGDMIKRGTKLIILEAMKMENEIRTPIDAQVGDVLVKEGDKVEKDQTIITLR